jgi:hypothetical protein
VQAFGECGLGHGVSRFGGRWAERRVRPCNPQT